MKTISNTPKTRLLLFLAGLLATVALFAETTLSGDYCITGKLRVEDSGSATDAGIESVAMGAGASAAGGGAFALGPNAIASAINTVALGPSSSASVGGATAVGPFANANGSCSLSLGYYATTNGALSTALGNDLAVSSYACVAVGQYNLAQTGQNSTAWVSTDDLFVIGNGTASNSTANAVVVSKNGSVTIKKRQGDIIMGSFGNGGGD
jgi:hypothetical protein